MASSTQARIQLTHRIMRASLSTQGITHHDMTSPSSWTQTLHRQGGSHRQSRSIIEERIGTFRIINYQTMRRL